MAFVQVLLNYDRRFASPASWFWIDDLHKVRARFRLCGEELSPVDLHCYFRGPKPPGGVRIAPRPDGTFATSIVEVRPDLIRCEFVLAGATSEVADAIARI